MNTTADPSEKTKLERIVAENFSLRRDLAKARRNSYQRAYEAFQHDRGVSLRQLEWVRRRLTHYSKLYTGE